MQESSIEQRLAAYAALATAAGVSLLASTEPARAEVVFTPSNAHVTCRSTFTIDFNNDGITDFKFLSSGTFHVNAILISGPDGNSVIVNNTLSHSASALQPHAPIVPTRNFHPVSMSSRDHAVIVAGDVLSYYFGFFPNTRNRALGVRFRINGENHYGWIGFRRFVGGCDGTLAGWAYETIPNRPLRAGQTGGKSDEVTLSPQSYEDSDLPIPATPAVLSLGSEGLKLWRKQGN